VFPIHNGLVRLGFGSPVARPFAATDGQANGGYRLITSAIQMPN